MKAKYIRVSTLEQNTARQNVGCKEYKLYEDKLSGLIPFSKRSAAIKLMEDIEKGYINYVHISSIDRLGRNVIDIQNQLNWFVDRKVQVYAENIQMNLLNEDGTLNAIAKMIIDLLSSVASIEINAIKERQMQGINIAKVKGDIYKGRKRGAVMSDKDYLKRHKDVVSLLKDGLSLNKISKLTGKAFVTVKSVDQKLNSLIA
ncbi:recombinase family protein [Ancylomarina euxinus]|nr:recombinase family protein [Ancylomarina euxinus]MCZ4693313.1 recombinase family protein [Ancylomarina euxinus]